MMIYRIIALFLLFAFPALAQNETSPAKIPEGMEEIQITGSASLIVPKGAKTRKVGAQIIVEGTKEYMSRKFLEVEEQLKKIELRLADIEKKLDSPAPAAEKGQ